MHPDVAFAALQLLQFLINLSKEHIAAVDWAIFYLWKMHFLAIKFKGISTKLQLLIALNASFANNSET